MYFNRNRFRAYYELTGHFQVASDVESTWRFFSTAENLPLITPPWLRFMPVRAGAIELDSVLEYTIRWMHIPVKWRTRIIDFSPPRQFIDLQTKGPYALWHHQHTFTPAPVGNGVICFDRVTYALPVPLVGRWVHERIVRRQLTEIFRYRRTVIGERLGWVRAVQPDVQIRRI